MLCIFIIYLFYCYKIEIVLFHCSVGSQMEKRIECNASPFTCADCSSGILFLLNNFSSEQSPSDKSMSCLDFNLEIYFKHIVHFLVYWAPKQKFTLAHTH